MATNVSDNREFQCSECGGEFHVLERVPVKLGEWEFRPEPMFCPGCGAKVHEGTTNYDVFFGSPESVSATIDLLLCESREGPCSECPMWELSKGESCSGQMADWLRMEAEEEL